MDWNEMSVDDTISSQEEKKLRFDEQSSEENRADTQTVQNESIDPLSCIKHFSIVEFAKRLVDEVIEETDGRMQNFQKLTSTIFIEGIRILGEHVPSENSSESSETAPLHWPSIAEFNEVEAIATIDNYISMWKLKERWKHVIKLIKTESDQISDIYTFDAMFSIPTKLYPIPQATASVYFTMEVSRVCSDQCPVDVYYNLETSRQKFYPGQFQFQEMWLNNIVDAKIKFYKTLRF